jgi:hypothetical protein
MKQKKIHYSYLNRVAKGNTWIAGRLYMQALHHKQVLIGEQQIGEVNPLFQMATITFTP